MTASSSRGITFPRLALVFFCLSAGYFFRDAWLPSQHHKHQSAYLPPPTESVDASHTPIDTTPLPNISSESCIEAPGADKVLVLLKTGATELYQKLPTHFVTTFTCVPHFMIYSDLAQSFADYPVHDAIAPISRHFRDHHEDFALYRKLRQYQAEGQDMSKLKGDGGWNLDKWKFMPMLRTAFEAATPEIEWFVVMEADTSISWTNLLQWLRTMDPTKPYYLGAQNNIGDTTFAHGGSGVIISRATADLVLSYRNYVGNNTYDENWEERTSTSCCGDEIIARAFKQVDVPLTPAWPLIQGETVSSIDWKEEHWCRPAITWHHVQPIEVDKMFQFQNDWVDQHGWDTPYLYRDVFAHFIQRHIGVVRTSWNNMSQDRKIVAAALANHDDLDFYNLPPHEQEAVQSQEACQAACLEREECVQWMFAPGRCYLGDVVRFGQSDEREAKEEHWVSGWMEHRIEEFKRRLEGCEVNWKGV